MIAVEVRPAHDCFDSLASCGYPTAASTGVQAGTSLTTVNGNVDLNKPGQVYAGKLVNGWITVSAPNVTINNVEVINTVADGDQGKEPWGIYLAAGSTNVLIENTTVHGADATTNATEYAVWNPVDANSTNVLNRVHLYNCTECFYGGGTLENSFVEANGSYPSAHIEATYYQGGQAFVRYRHNTILAPNMADPPTAVIYSAPDKGPIRNMTIANNFLSGGGYTIYAGGQTSSNVSIKNNRFGRNYYPIGGRFGLLGYSQPSLVWSGNIWDDTALGVSRP
jgi:hypothetical protein